MDLMAQRGSETGLPSKVAAFAYLEVGWGVVFPRYAGKHWFVKLLKEKIRAASQGFRSLRPGI